MPARSTSTREVRRTEPTPSPATAWSVNLAGTGNAGTCPPPVEQYMVKPMAEHGFGSHLTRASEDAPAEVLKRQERRDRRVDGPAPAGRAEGRSSSTCTSRPSGTEQHDQPGRRAAVPVGPGSRRRQTRRTRLQRTPRVGLRRRPGLRQPRLRCEPAPVPTGAARRACGAASSWTAAMSQATARSILRRRARRSEPRPRHRAAASSSECSSPAKEAGRSPQARTRASSTCTFPASFSGDWQHFVGRGHAPVPRRPAGQSASR